MAENKVTVTFENATCGRCGGSGQYPSSCWNGICLGCNGSGVKTTRSGVAAHKIFESVLDNMNRRVDDVRVGDRVWIDAGTIRKSWRTVLDIGDGGTFTTTSGGVKTVHYQIALGFEKSSYCMNRETLIRVWDRDVYLAAARRMMKLRGATVTGLDEELTAKPEPVSSPVTDRMVTHKKSGHINHGLCDHVRTPKARAACRAARG